MPTNPLPITTGVRMDAESLHKAMLNLDTYPGEAGPVTFRETHVSRLYFTARHVYKIKKRVDFGFLNFTSLDRRRFYSQEELRLNRRFCAETYLEIVEIRRHGTGCRAGTGLEGDLVDYAVRMKRLPQERMLDVLIEADEPTLSVDIQRLGRHLGQLHLDSEIRQHTGGRTHADMVALNWEENLRQTAPFVGKTLPTKGQALVAAHVDRFISEQSALLEQREKSGFVIDGHGDLHAEHICLTDPICIYDCIEFNERFRVGDRLADLAFLLMDLEHRNRRDLAASLLYAYHETTGADPDLPILLPFYKLYRAWVRGKVLSFLTRDSSADPTEQKPALGQAQSYFSLAISYLCPPALILTCGLMGAGKTTVARELAQVLGARLLRSDELRKQLSGMTPADRDHAGFGQGIYSPGMSKKTYQGLLEEAKKRLAHGQTVIVDASFALSRDREQFRQTAEASGVAFRILWMTCSEKTLLNRLLRRQAAADDASDGRPELLDQQKGLFQSPSQEADILQVDTSSDIAYSIALILCDLAERDAQKPPDN
ncbi:AAA family ATPase [Trichloromonas sp.]|uniref:bifunctional aminoglycoside phosphotransferase/ATP-binding protein n=1 Tax=Trichloromonas sp. TaxID=3069249 RepID=UPI003D816BE5